MAEIRGADFVTLLNALLGTTAVLSLITPLPLGAPPLGLTVADIFLLFITLALIGDGLDGLVARRFGMSRAGRMLDSLSDAITFGLAPAAFATSTLGWEVLPAVLFFLACAMWRLAVFTTLDKPKVVFRGLPSPVAGITLLAASLLPAGLLPVAPLWILSALAVLMGVLMVSGIRYPKIRGRYQPMLVAYAVVAALHVVVYFAVAAWRPWVVLSGMGVGVATILVAPFTVEGLVEEE